MVVVGGGVNSCSILHLAAEDNRDLVGETKILGVCFQDTAVLGQGSRSWKNVALSEGETSVSV